MNSVLLIIITCRACGTVLYEGYELRLPEEIAKQNRLSCPGCATSLDVFPHEVKIDVTKGKG